MYLTLFIIVLINVTKQTKAETQDQCSILNIQDDDTRLNFTEMAIKNGYKCEEHDVITKDGYILKMFHIPGNVSRPVLLMHGFLDSADSYILRGNRSLAGHLADSGYDVWVGNSRGNRYSRRHLHLNPDADIAFWDYSVHEYGSYDLPAVIDFILEKTNQSQINYIGHSEGTTMMYVMGAHKRKYNEKIKLFVALAPVCYLHKSMSPLPALLKTVLFVNRFLINVVHEILSYNSLAKKMIDLVCSDDVFSYTVCIEWFLFSGTGSDAEEFEPSFLPTVIGHLPAGTSNKNMNHFAQISNRKQFAQYDYGCLENLKRYGSFVPPRYNLKNVNMKVALFVSRNDKFATLENVKLLTDQLPNVVHKHVMEQKQWNHIDFTWGKHAYKYLYPKVSGILDKYN
ncbi:unnamed protein product [Chilo suppressalis]|uniref:Lipase n=1 Tax=Chilo suppressalis TaxID=168631 RepID=A0ABN8B6B7_CHISP|nr:unnamed protein product [Chilo suppressalis]